jgi:hypothetical protein
MKYHVSYTSHLHVFTHTIINNMIASVAGISILGFVQITYARFMCAQDAMQFS